MTLSVQNGTFSYKKGNPVLKDISFSASSGDIVAVLGPNGAGKTTLLRCIMGFLHWNSGKSLLDGKDIRSYSFRELWQKVAYVPQAKGVASSLFTEEMILLGRSSRLSAFAQPGQKDLETVEKIMEQLHILGLKGKRCSQISGGELQMILIARALASQPEILILDEPESNLDFKNQLIVLDTISRLAASGIVCIFNTHYPAHALQRANKSLLLGQDGGYIFGATHTVVTEENIEKAFHVKAVIGEIETPGNIYKNVVPLEILGDDTAAMHTKRISTRRIAVVSIIAKDFSVSENINALLHDYNKYLIGRMGMPYKKCGVFIIQATLDAPQEEIESLAEQLNILPLVSVKVTYAQGTFKEAEQDE